MRRHLTSALSVALLLAGTVAAHAATSTGPSISDSSFETPALTPDAYAYYPVAAGADFSAGVGGAGVQSNGSAFNFAAAPDGVQTAFIQTSGAISLNVSGLTPGERYAVSFYDADRPGYAVNPIQVSYSDVNDPVLGVFAPLSAAFNLVTTGSFLANSSYGSLNFASTTSGPIDTDIAIDKVSISAVPEPSTWALMIIGLGGIGLILRRARKTMGFRFRSTMTA